MNAASTRLSIGRFCLSIYFIGLSRHNEVSFVQAANLMAPPLDRACSPPIYELTSNSIQISGADIVNQV